MRLETMSTNSHIQLVCAYSNFLFVLIGSHNEDKNIYYHHVTIQYVSSNIPFLLSVRHNANKDT